MLVAAPHAAGAQPAPTYVDVAPIFKQHCVLCHAGPSAPAGLRLDALTTD